MSQAGSDETVSSVTTPQSLVEERVGVGLRNWDTADGTCGVVFQSDQRPSCF